ncbi:DUF1127 domain-containing protein [Pseudomonas costantinii]|uniref:Uncharacterized conserved protein YjiS, DUF1127 family n=1 Tax=Pseudomonas costantinii TaxID=168469 RepID=A0A1S2ULG4_9PSED|nr:DUF1127 domain-containing protein [Pseudomonas costantinii]NVZ20666.1 DUF1127 domain-containing protein [Pseudomonas costantinii]NVZ73131.1 DUF1127 domain-containing protein [Pseudomonas costantinii]OIN46866.1 hypothetical protein BFL40_26745 [Pseudomonas costantinii]SEE02377.1 Uncharacterized conserved protein YjiS, DUF1127 family [Pseudomonas costantinii]
MNTRLSSYKPLLSRAAYALLRWMQRAHERRQLAQLDPRELSDAGITSGDRMAELSKPFWRD